VWVGWTLATLFGSELGEHLVFKSGTSLSKAYRVIGRISEDVDLTYDIRAIAPDLVGKNGESLFEKGTTAELGMAPTQDGGSFSANFGAASASPPHRLMCLGEFSNRL